MRLIVGIYSADNEILGGFITVLYYCAITAFGVGLRVLLGILEL